jgi:hypothetical protein
MRNLLAALLALSFLLFCAGPALADCNVKGGEHVVLYGDEDDPSVFLWDTRIRLRDYHAASYDEAKALVPHAKLVGPGTRAIVVACVAGYVTSPYFDTPDDAVGVLIVSGPSHGKTYWVLRSDVHPVPKAKKQP